jgi:hypothetical protein
MLTEFNIFTASHLNLGLILKIGGLSIDFALPEATSHILKMLEKEKITISCSL